MPANALHWRIQGFKAGNHGWQYELVAGGYAQMWGTWKECVDYMRSHKLTNSKRKGMIAQ